MQKVTPFLWFDNQAEAAAKYYVSIFKNSKITNISYYGDTGPGPKGAVMVVIFQLNGEDFMGLNGGPMFKPNEAVSFMVVTADQAETDRYWNAIVGNGGAENDCGWCRDRWGFSWQITPRVLLEATTDPDRAAAKRAMTAMMSMKKIDVATIEAARRGEGR